jgi:hypothetical protein
MQEANMRIDTRNDLTIQLKHETQHTMRRRMLRSEIDGKIAKILFVHCVASGRIANSE